MVDLDRIVNILNLLKEYDKDCIVSLINNRVKANERLANHSYVEVNGDGEVGVLAMINGFIEPLFHERIAAKFDKDNNFVEFCRYKCKSRVFAGS